MAKAKNEVKNLLTQETYKKFQEEHDYLVQVERPAVQAALKEARAQGDLSENAEYDAARDRQAEIEGRILQLEDILQNAIVHDDLNQDNLKKDKATIGSIVKYLIVDKGIEREVKILGTHESNPMEGIISNESPLAQALMETAVGNEVEVEAPKKYTIKVIEIK